MQRIHVTMLLHNTLELADTWVNPFLRGHHISRHVLLCFPPLLVLLWAMDAQNRWVAWLCGAFLYASFPLSRTPLFRANTFSAHTHTYTNPLNACTYQHTHAGMDIQAGTLIQWQTRRCHTHRHLHTLMLLWSLRRWSFLNWCRLHVGNSEPSGRRWITWRNRGGEDRYEEE